MNDLPKFADLRGFIQMTLNSIKNKIDRLEKAINRDRDMIVWIEPDGSIIYHDMHTNEDIPEEEGRAIMERDESEILVFDWTGFHDETDDGCATITVTNNKVKNK